MFLIHAVDLKDLLPGQKSQTTSSAASLGNQKLSYYSAATFQVLRR